MSASVWDDENVSEPVEEAEWRAMIKEIHEFLCALSADYLRLDIFLDIAVSDEGRLDFLEQTIPGAHTLLTTISMGVTMTTTNTETESNEVTVSSEVEDPDELAPVYVGPPEGIP
uniref:Uncharacterized protein n=1 Tax=Moniliophthora roreri TaxID=221103 RepID=A0A0W0FME7_MONRR